MSIISDMEQQPFLEGKEEQLRLPEEIAPLPDNEELFAESENRTRTGVDILRLPAEEQRQGGIINDMMLATPSQDNTHLSIMDYLGDASMETIAGVIEGASLENVEFGEVGPDTTVGDIARSMGQFAGSIGSYAGIAAVLGTLGAFSGPLSVPMVMGRAGLTAFTARMLKDVTDPEEDMLDRVEGALINSTIAVGISAVPYVFDKAILKFHGGPVKYMETLKRRLSTRLVKTFGFSEEQATRGAAEFEAAVQKQGGAKALNAAMLKRIERGQETAKGFLKMQRAVHTIAKSKKALGLSQEEFYRTNLAIAGEVHTNKMQPNTLRDLQKHYVFMLRKFREAKGFGPDKDYTELMVNYTGFNPGFFSGHRPVERVLRQMGLQKLYDRVYGAKLATLTEQRGYDQARRALGRSVSKGQKEALFKMVDQVPIPVRNAVTGMKLSDSEIYSIYARYAKTFKVDPKNITAATWIRSTSRKLLERMNAQLLSQGKAPIVEREAYITHLLQDTGDKLGGITPEIWAALRHSQGGGETSRFLLHRLGLGDVLKDPFRAHQAYVKAALKMVHLGPAKNAVWKKLNAATTLENGKKVSAKLPENVRTYIDKWLTNGVMEVATDSTKALNVTLGFSAKSVASRIKMQGYMGTLWGNPLSVLRNTTQQTLNIARLGKYWLHGIASFNPQREFMKGLNGWQFADKYCKLLQGRAPALEGMDPTTMGFLVKLGFSPFRLVDKSNIVAGFNGAVKKELALGRTFAQAIKTADRLVRDTQFNYLNIDQPIQWLSASGRLGSQFQSWWTRYLEEIWSWGGTMPVGDGTGRTMKIAKHAFNVAKSREMARYLMINTTLLYGLHKAGLPLRSLSLPLPQIVETKIQLPGVEGKTTIKTPGITSGSLPTGLPPSIKGLLSMGQFAYGTLLGDKRVQTEGWYNVKRQLPIHFIPGYTTIRKGVKIYKGDLPLKALLFPINEKEFKKQMELML